MGKQAWIFFGPSAVFLLSEDVTYCICFLVCTSIWKNHWWTKPERRSVGVWASEKHECPELLRFIGYAALPDASLQKHWSRRCSPYSGPIPKMETHCSKTQESTMRNSMSLDWGCLFLCFVIFSARPICFFYSRNKIDIKLTFRCYIYVFQT